MNFCKKIFERLMDNKSVYFMFLPVIFFLFSVAFLLLLYPQIAFRGVTEGINICLESVIPSLFPFLIISSLMYDFGIFSAFSLKTEKIMRFIFDLPSVAFPIILMSLIGGFPVGATLIEKAYDSGYLSRTQAQRMLLFCVNPGPAFVVLTVGYAVIGSVQTGWIVYASVSLSSLIVGILSRFIFEENNDFIYKSSYAKADIMPGTLSVTISNATNNMITICVWVVIFSCLGSLTEILPVSSGVLISLKMISEVTVGSITAHEHFTVPVVASVISFAGFCVHFQVLSCIMKVRLKYKYFLSFRILCAALTSVLTLLLLELFPQYSQTISMGTKPEIASTYSSPFVCVCLMLMCGLFIIGDNYYVNKRELKHNKKRNYQKNNSLR